MGLKREKILTTRYFDLDWNRHVTSRTYERFGYDARMEILNEIGYPISKCLSEGISYISKSTYVRFLSQQFSGANIKVATELTLDDNGILYWNQELFGEDGKKACTLLVTSYLTKNGHVHFPEGISTESVNWHEFTIHEKPKDQTTLQHDYYIPFSDMNCFWNLPSESIWKVFEEGRFLFFKEIVDLNLIKETDATTFFMGGEIIIHKLPEPGTHITLHSWIETVEKIRFYFRQDIVDSDGNVLVSMKDEQLFVALSTSRPKKAPPEFIQKIEKFIEK